MEQKIKIYSELRKNESYIRDKFKNCADILIRPMRLGNESKVDCLIVYIEVAVSNMMLDDSALGKMINHFWESSSYQIQEFVQNNSLGIADVRKLESMKDVLSASSGRKCRFLYRRIRQGNENIQQRLSESGCFRSGIGKSSERFQRRIF